MTFKELIICIVAVTALVFVFVPVLKQQAEVEQNSQPPAPVVPAPSETPKQSNAPALSGFTIRYVFLSGDRFLPCIVKELTETSTGKRWIIVANPNGGIAITEISK